MANGVVIACTDGSERSRAALQDGLALVRPDAEVVLVTVVPPADPMLVSGTGFAGGTMTPDEVDELEATQRQQAGALLESVAGELGVPDARREVLRGPTGSTICDLAETEGAVAIVIGSRGQGGFKRAVLGSVSDHVVRNAPCPVVVSTGER